MAENEKSYMDDGLYEPSPNHPVQNPIKEK